MSTQDAVNQPVLRNKISPPRLRPNRIHRGQLVARVEQSIWSKLTLFCAPAGYGKTSIINEWADTTRIKVSWLQLDEEDNILYNFIQALVASLAVQIPNFGSTLTPTFQHSQLPPPEQVAQLLLHEMEKQTEPVVSVIDDYHLIHQMDIHTLMNELLRRLPENFHLLIATREEPPFHLARMRAKDEVQEIRMTELHFTRAEVDQFLNQLLHLDLSPVQIETLFVRTEGWPAGIHLAALSLKETADPAEMIDHFAGSNRFILDFLMEEVLDHLDENTRRFLLRVSILDQFNAALTGKLTSDIPNPPRLVDLEADNLFITAIDPDRTWFRLHPLFADMLRSRLREEMQGDEIKNLYDTAAGWEAENELYPESVQHYLQAGNPQKAGDSAIVYASLLMESGESGRCTAWLDHLPSELTQSSLGIQMVYGYASISNSQFARAKEHADVAQGLFDAISAYLDPAQKADIQARINCIQALVAAEDGQIDEAQRLSDLAIPHLPITDPVRTSLWLGLASGYQHQGHAQDAIHCLQKAIEESTTREQNSIRIIAQNNLAMIYLEMGDFQRAQEISKASLAKSDPEKDPLISIAFLYLSFIAYERNQIELGKEMADKGLPLVRRWGNLDILCSLYHVSCLIALAAGRPGEAADKYHEYAELAGSLPPGQVSHDLFLGISLRYHLMTDQLALAKKLYNQTFNQMLRPVGFQADNLWYERAVAELWLDHHLEEATREKLLEIQQRTRSGGRIILHLQTSLLLLLEKSLTSTRNGNPQEIHDLILQCKQTGLFRSLVDLVPILHPMLTGVLESNGKDIHDYVRSILKEATLSSEAQAIKGIQTGSELLSEREIEVLRLLAGGLSNTLIAQRLYVSPGTIKRHLHNIFIKLGATSRLDAVTRARSQGYLT